MNTRTSAVNSDQIPKQLKALPNWVCWRYTTRAGKTTKVLLNPKALGDLADSSDPATWGSFNATLQYFKARKDNGVAGIGFQFSNSPFVGVDLDNCRDPETGTVETWAQEIIEKIGSYTEISPSGTGIHIFARGQLPPGGRRKGNVEMYDEGRYFTVTGARLPDSPEIINERTAELAAIHPQYIGQDEPPKAPEKPAAPVNASDEELLGRMLKAVNGARVRKLLDGDHSDYPSQSEADMALCYILAFWTGKDADRIDRLFRKTGLYRPKWDEKHYGDGSTYGQETIRRAIERTDETYTPAIPKDAAGEMPGENHSITVGVAGPKQGESKNPIALKVVSVTEFLSMEFPPRKSLLSPWLYTQGLCMVHSFRGVGKTLVGIGIAVAGTSGGSFLPWNAPEPFGVLYIDGEMPASVLQERFAQAIHSSETEPVAPLRIITPDLQEAGMPDLSTEEGQAALEPHLEGVSLVIVDNISTLCRTGRENEGESWLPLQAWALRLRSRGFAVLFFHHDGKGGLQRGASRKEDVLHAVIHLTRPGDYRPEEGARLEVHFEKARMIFGEDVKPFEAQLITNGGTQAWTTKTLEESLTQRVADLLNDGVPQHEIPEMLGVAKGTVSKHKKDAKNKGLLREEK